MRHYLALEIPEVANPYTLSIWDSSTYSDNLDVDCLRLDIYLPGYTIPVYYTDLLQGFNKNLNAMDLEAQAIITLTTKVTAVAIADAGTGYAIGDILTVTTGTGTAATITVATVDGSGVIQTIALTTGGVYTADPIQLGSVTSTDSAVGAGATLNLTMGVNTSQAQDLFSLPDGIYQIRYSVAPNDKVYSEYLHLRTTRLRNMYRAELCKIITGCCNPSDMQRKKLADLHYINQVISAAKAKVEYCGAIKQGMAMLIDADKLLGKYISKGCLSC